MHFVLCLVPEHSITISDSFPQLYRYKHTIHFILTSLFNIVNVKHILQQ